jgi:hypothetical protein
MSAVADNAIRASMAYRGAVEDYGNFIDTTMRQYGWTMPDSSGQYSVQGAQDAFDPDRVIQYDTSGKPTFDLERVAAQTSGGQYGTTGLFAETAQESAAQEADVRMAARGRGFGAGSGLSRQAELAAETQAGRAMGQVSAGLFSDIFSRYGNLGRLYGDVATGEVTDALIRAEGDVANMPLSEATAPMPEEPAAPVDAAGPAYTGDRGKFAQGSEGGRYVMPIEERKQYTKKANNQQLRAGGVPISGGKPGQVFTGKGGTRYVRRQDGWYVIR